MKMIFNLFLCKTLVYEIAQTYGGGNKNVDKCIITHGGVHLYAIAGLVATLIKKWGTGSIPFYR